MNSVRFAGDRKMTRNVRSTECLTWKKWLDEPRNDETKCLPLFLWLSTVWSLLTNIIQDSSPYPSIACHIWQYYITRASLRFEKTRENIDVFEDVARYSVFFRTEVKPYIPPLIHTCWTSLLSSSSVRASTKPAWCTVWNRLCSSTVCQHFEISNVEMRNYKGVKVS